jgi:hypothetical protein
LLGTASTRRQSRWSYASAERSRCGVVSTHWRTRRTTEDVVHQVRCEGRHAPPGARRAEAATLAGERDQQILLARVAAEAGDAARELAAGEELTQLALDEVR